MHLRGLDLNLLVALDILLDERNVTRAADRMNLSQSGMSTALLRLREFFGDQLLVPIGRKMMLTPLAQTLVSPSREIVLRAQTLIEATPGFNPATAVRTCVVMTSDYVTVTLMSSVAQRLARDAPGIVLQILPHAADPKAVLERGDIDFLIMPEQYLSPEHPTARLFEDRYVCVSCKNNSLFEGHPDLDTYLDLGHVVPRFGALRGMAFDEWFVERFDRHRRVEAVVLGFALLPWFVIGTNRLATVHNLVARQFSSLLDIAVHPLPFEMPNVVEALQWNRFSDAHPAIVWLRDILADEAAKLNRLLRV